jgi:DNA-binding PadR family transcriptional regulator
MAFRFKESDCKILESIAEHRMLTVNQIAMLFRKNKQSIWRRLRELERAELINADKREFGRGRGRPEIVLSLSESGLDVLREKGLIDTDVPYENVLLDKINCPDHQFMLNWFRIYLNQVTGLLPQLSTKFLTHNSPFLPRDPAGRPIITDFAPIEGENEKAVKFTPDAVISISDSVQNKTLLFFLEVDTGTETIASPKRELTDIRQKILNYQSYFQSLRYKKYEKLWRCQLNGFRLLFLTNSLGRLTALSRLIQEMPPADFVWLTQLSRVCDEGLHSEIWVRDGKLDTMPHSIFGSIQFPSAPSE